MCPVELSMLKYVEVNVTCDETSCVKCLSGLCDSGAEVNVISSSVVDDFVSRSEWQNSTETIFR